MRTFSRQEQDFMKKLIENSKGLTPNFPVNILDDYFNENQFDIEHLVQFLMKNGLVHKIEFNKNKLNKFGYDGFQYNLEAIDCCLNNPFFGMETLKNLAKNNFESIEKQNLKESMTQRKLSCQSLERLTNNVNWLFLSCCQVFLFLH